MSARGGAVERVSIQAAMASNVSVKEEVSEKLPPGLPQMESDCDSWCRTVLCKSDKTTFKWTIENFKERPEKRYEGIPSPRFKVTGPGNMTTTWSLRLFPQGDDSDSEYITVHLMSLNDFDVKVKGNVSILAPDSQMNMKKYYPVSLDGTYPKVEDDRAIYADGLDGLLVKIVTSRLMLQDGNLTLLCELEVYGPDRHFGVSKSNELSDKSLRKVNLELGNIFGDKTFSDVKIKCKRKAFFCHRAILSARSPYFMAMFQADTLENKTRKVYIRDFKAKVVSEMLHYIYKGTVSSEGVFMEIEMAKELLVAADKYQLDLLKQLCEVQLQSSLNASNCIELLIFGDTHQAKTLKEGALQSIVMNEIIGTETYKDFHKQHPELSLEVTRYSQGRNEGGRGREGMGINTLC